MIVKEGNNLIKNQSLLPERRMAWAVITWRGELKPCFCKSRSRDPSCRLLLPGNGDDSADRPHGVVGMLNASAWISEFRARGALRSPPDLCEMFTYLRFHVRTTGFGWHGHGSLTNCSLAPQMSFRPSTCCVSKMGPFPSNSCSLTKKRNKSRNWSNLNKSEVTSLW